MNVDCSLPGGRAWTVGLVFCALLLSGSFVSCRAEQNAQSNRAYVAAGGGAKFDVTRHIIPIEKIRAGGPPKDGIPALTHPEFVSAEQGDERLRDADRLLGLVFNGEAKAYPIRILNWHEIVNDTVGGRPVAVTW